MFADLFRPRLIVGALPVTLTNGTTADAVQVMADLNWIVNQVNANAVALTDAALVNANNNFSVVQSGIAAAQPANFPIASQVQNQVFNSLSSTLGTNTLTARCAALPLPSYAAGQVFTFVPSQTNTGPANLTVDSAGSSIIFTMGSTLVGGELRAGVPATVFYDGTKLNLENPSAPKLSNYQVVLGADVALNNTAAEFNVLQVNTGGKGTWTFAATLTLFDTIGPAEFSVRVTDGANTIASSVTQSRVANAPVSITVVGIVQNPAVILLLARDITSVGGSVQFNRSGLSMDTMLIAERIA
jgi:hypothetical protein